MKPLHVTVALVIAVAALLSLRPGLATEYAANASFATEDRGAAARGPAEKFCAPAPAPSLKSTGARSPDLPA
jgi:hypothetical protein